MGESGSCLIDTPEDMNEEPVENAPDTGPALDESGNARGLLARHQPELGWPLVTMLVLIVILNLYYLINFIRVYDVRRMSPAEQVSFLLFFQCAPILRIAGATGMLRCKRWGFYAYLFVTFAYLVLSVYFDFHAARFAQEFFLLVILILLLHPQWELLE